MSKLLNQGNKFLLQHKRFRKKSLNISKMKKRENIDGLKTWPNFKPDSIFFSASPLKEKFTASRLKEGKLGEFYVEWEKFVKNADLYAKGVLNEHVEEEVGENGLMVYDNNKKYYLNNHGYIREVLDDAISCADGTMDLTGKISKFAKGKPVSTIHDCNDNYVHNNVFVDKSGRAVKIQGEVPATCNKKEGPTPEPELEAKNHGAWIERACEASGDISEPSNTYEQRMTTAYNNMLKLFKTGANTDGTAACVNDSSKAILTLRAAIENNKSLVKSDTIKFWGYTVGSVILVYIAYKYIYKRNAD